MNKWKNRGKKKKSVTRTLPAALLASAQAVENDDPSMEGETEIHSRSEIIIIGSFEYELTMKIITPAPGSPFPEKMQPITLEDCERMHYSILTGHVCRKSKP